MEKPSPPPQDLSSVSDYDKIAEGYYRSADPARAEAIINNVTERIEAASGWRGDFIFADQGTDHALFRVRETWEVGSTWESNKYSGNHGKGCYGADSIDDVKAKAQAAADAIVAGEGIEALVGLQDKNAMSMMRSDEKISLPLARSYAYVYNCPSCGGSGSVTCSSCNGQGGRFEYVLRSRYNCETNCQENYSSYENVPCSVCGGRRSLGCGACDCTGCMTYRADVEGHAVSSLDYIVFHAGNRGSNPLGDAKRF